MKNLSTQKPFTKQITDLKTNTKVKYFNQKIDIEDFNPIKKKLENIFLSKGFAIFECEKYLQVFKSQEDGINSLSDFEKEVNNILTNNKTNRCY